LEREAIAHVQSRYQARRDTVAALGKELGLLRQAHGLTQAAVAAALGTKKSNISRLESGRYGGLTIEYFMAVIDAFRALDQSRARVRGQDRRTARDDGASNKVLHPAKSSRALGLRG
jgi:transcriptional regulator with XRE-family HTH domain